MEFFTIGLLSPIKEKKKDQWRRRSIDMVIVLDLTVNKNKFKKREHNGIFRYAFPRYCMSTVFDS